jgi:hypothetical protein
MCLRRKYLKEASSSLCDIQTLHIHSATINFPDWGHEMPHKNIKFMY